MVAESMTDRDLRSTLIDQIGHLDRDQLLEVYQFIAKSFALELLELVNKAEDSGDVSSKSIEELVSDHRAKHPYG